MVTFQNSTVIERPVDEVFDLVSDLTSIPKWNHYVQSVTPTSNIPGVEGATYHQVRRNYEQNLRISRSEADRVLIIESIPPSEPELRREMMFQADGNSTRLLDKWPLDMGVPGLLEPLAARRAKAGVRENLGKLKTLVETGEVTLQDGRYLCFDRISRSPDEMPVPPPLSSRKDRSRRVRDQGGIARIMKGIPEKEG